MQSPEEYRKNPIFKTDFSKPLSQILELVRADLLTARNKLDDIKRGYPCFDYNAIMMQGLLTCGVSTLYHLIEERKEVEITTADRTNGPSLPFRPRGIGSDSCPCCFVCSTMALLPPAKPWPLLSNIAAFVRSKDEGETIVGWFEHKAWLDYRDYEPHRIQLKVGACAAHLPQLEFLLRRTEYYNVIRKSDIEAAVNFLDTKDNLISRPR